MKYGTKMVMLGIHDPYPLQCPECKQLGTVEFAVYGEYFHCWYIPFFPVEKDGFASYTHCHFRINSLKFNKLTKEDFKTIRKKFRYPFYTYLGAALVLIPISLGILLLIIELITGS